MNKIRLSKSRLTAAAVLIVILVVGILFPIAGTGARYVTQVSVKGSVSYMLDSDLAKSIRAYDVDDPGVNTESFQLIPGTVVTPTTKIAIEDRTTIPAYLYVEVSGDYSPNMAGGWNLIEGVTGPSGGKVYVYGEGTYDQGNVNVISVFDGKSVPENASELPSRDVDANAVVYLVEKKDDVSAADTFASFVRGDSGLKSQSSNRATEHFTKATVDAAVNDNYTVTNTGSIKEFIRVAVVLNRVDGAGNIEAVNIDELTVPYGWTKVGEYLYYNGRVDPEGVTVAVLDPAGIPEGVTVTVIAEAIQAEGGAVEDAWTEASYDTETSNWTPAGTP